MQSKKFINCEVIERKSWKMPVFIGCAVFIILANLILYFNDGREYVNMFSVVFMPTIVLICALIQPLTQRRIITVIEELSQTDNGICIHIPSIDRMDKLGKHEEKYIWKKEDVANLIFHPAASKVELIGKPMKILQVGGSEKVVECVDNYTFVIRCREDHIDSIVYMLQNGLQRIAEQK